MEPLRRLTRPNTMKPIHVALVLMTSLVIGGGCTSEEPGLPSDAAFVMSPTETATPEPEEEPGRAASQRIKLPVGHCWIDPVRFDGALWAVGAKDQFGSGEGFSRRWAGRGTITRLSELRSRYVDDGGHVLRLVPADDPRAARVFERGCD